ncbi:transposase [Streptomyces canus]|uniref:transposase n=1 Tax=Streptomyces canus TaxID=58343 RepID=UPI003AF393E8
MGTVLAPDGGSIAVEEVVSGPVEGSTSRQAARARSQVPVWREGLAWSVLSVEIEDPPEGGARCGADGGKLINGRKRHVVVDTRGLLLGVMVTAADTGDRAAAQVLLEQVADAHHRLALVWADGGYTGPLVEYCLATLALVLATVKRSDDMRGFVVLPKRWIVGRLFAHLYHRPRRGRGSGTEPDQRLR